VLNAFEQSRDASDLLEVTAKEQNAALSPTSRRTRRAGAGLPMLISSALA